MLSPPFALLLLALGLAGILYEFRNPRFILPGAAGLSLLLTGGYFGWRQSAASCALPLLVVAAVLLGAEAFCNTRFVAGTLSTAAFAAAFCSMFNRTLPLALAVSFVFGPAIMLLLHHAKRARRNKQVDL